MSRRVTAFDGQTLDDCTTYFHQSTVDGGEIPIRSIVRDVGGNIYDADGSSDNDSYPGIVTVEMVVKAASAAAFVTATGNIEGLHKTKGTLTGTDANSGTDTCTARCYVKAGQTAAMNQARFYQPYTLTFEQTTNWA